jgi:putative tricarboxylic transport membrane protein
MFEAALQGIQLVTEPAALLVMLAGVMIGTFTGAMPGINGTITLAILLPFAVKMGPIEALCLLMGSHVAVEFGGSISAILINVPGTGQAIATCWDGYPMAKKGEAARAISIAAVCSGIGGLIGFLALIMAIPVMKELALALGPPEYFVLTFVGVTFIAVLGDKSFIKSLISGGLGLMVAMIGLDPVTSSTRFTFGQLYLWDGIDLIAVVVGMFAFAEMLDMISEGMGKTVAKITELKNPWPQVWQGFKDVFIYWKVTVVTSIMGVLIGAIPGLGGTVANIMGYVVAKRVSKHPELFGTGTPEAIIGPEAANNSKEGGNLIPTLAFGIPGTTSMAIFLGVFVMMGLVPGPEMLGKNLHYTFALAWILALANILATGIGMFTAGALARFTVVPARYLVPVVLGMGTVGAFATAEAWESVLVAVIFGFIGFAFRKFGYPNAPFMITLVLGTVVERYLHLATRLYGDFFFIERPISLGIILVTVAFAVWQMARKRKGESLVSTEGL